MNTMMKAGIVCLLIIPAEAYAFDKDPTNDEIDSGTNKLVSDEYCVASKTVSEYDMIQDMRLLSKEELRQAGLTDNDIMRINQPLKARETYGKVTYTITFTDMYQKNGNTYLKTKATWSWSKAPTVLLTDVIAMTTSESFTKDSAACKINYYPNGDKNRAKTTYSGTVKTEDAGRGVFSRISMGNDWDVANHSYKRIAMSGYMTTTWSIGKKITQAGIASNYGHSIVGCTPSISIGKKTASISFTPEKKCKSGDEAYTKATLTK